MFVVQREREKNEASDIEKNKFLHQYFAEEDEEDEVNKIKKHSSFWMAWRTVEAVPGFVLCKAAVRHRGVSESIYRGCKKDTYNKSRRLRGLSTYMKRERKNC